MVFKFEFYSLVFAVILLLYMFLGLRKGFIYMLLYMVFPVVLFFVAAIAAQPLADLLMNKTAIGEAIYNPVYSFLGDKSTYFAEQNPGRELLATVLSSNNYEAMTQMNIPAFLAPIVAALILAAIPEQADTVLVGEYVAKGATYALIYIVCVILVYVVLNLILRIFKKISAKNKKRRRDEGFNIKPNGLSRLLGMACGVGVGLFSIFIITYALDLLFMPDSSLRNFLNILWYVDDPTVMTIGKWLILDNPLKKWLLNLFEYFTF